jgi:hypothetical protein
VGLLNQLHLGLAAAPAPTSLATYLGFDSSSAPDSLEPELMREALFSMISRLFLTIQRESLTTFVALALNQEQSI